MIFRCAISLLLALSLLAQSPITFQYVYDASGQLIKAVDSTGVVIDYVYDAVGNMTDIKRSNIAPSGLAIFSFTPLQGGPLTRVTIQGQGFNPTPTGNIVRFNGLAGTMLSASATTLVVQTPAGTATGPISVQVGAATATSSTSFAALPIPVITSVLPRAVAAGATIGAFQVTGVNLTASTFSFQPAFVPAAITITSVAIAPGGNSATLGLSVGSNAAGTFVLIATNAVGSSDPFPSPVNSIGVSTSPNSDSDGDGYPDGLEIALGSDPFDANSVPVIPTVKETESVSFSVLNSSVGGPGIRETESIAFSVLNGAVGGTAIRETESVAFSVLNGAVGGTGIRETESISFSVLNGAVGGIGIRETSSIAFSVLNSAVAGSALRETSSNAFSVLNGAVSGNALRETSSVPFSIQNGPVAIPAKPSIQQPPPATTQLDTPGSKEAVAVSGNAPEESILDSDGDLLNDYMELILGTDPYRPDTDDDGLSDGAEVLIYKTDPLDRDSDHDGFTDREEIEAGSDPLEPLSTPVIAKSPQQKFEGDQNVQHKELVHRSLVARVFAFGRRVVRTESSFQ